MHSIADRLGTLSRKGISAPFFIWAAPELFPGGALAMKEVTP